MNEPLDNLLTQLCNGDVAAAERVFVAYEPYLRKAICRHFPPALRARFDPADILQSVWADLLRGFREAGWRFSDPDHLRGFLYIAARNRLIDRVRQHQKVAAREQHLGAGKSQVYLRSSQPRPSELAQAEDLWERILAHCPPEHRSILALKRQGYSLAEIAERTGFHRDSVRRILRTLARQLAFKPQQSERADQPPLATEPTVTVIGRAY
ncbi:MAG TPA: sigma-70 family RNA polymerase sigma factor [Gemmataceae bacterium]|nr:sigma-70 family RNA polymerase sigma factor [Gemmataceae bacterium]